MFYRGTEHKRKFTQEIISMGRHSTASSPAFLSALFLLTSDKKVWSRASRSVTTGGINFNEM